MNKSDKKESLCSLFVPFLFLLTMWLVKIIEVNFNFSFVKFGVSPQTFSGLKGILFSPFIHKDFTHLLNNSYPVLILGGMLFSFYQKDCSKNIFMAIFHFWFLALDNWKAIIPHWCKWNNLCACILYFSKWDNS